MEAIEDLLRRSAFRTIRTTIRYWRDTPTYVRALEKYSSHPRVGGLLREWTGRAAPQPDWWWRLWLKRPRWIRIEESKGGRATWDLRGGDGNSTWELVQGKLHVEADLSIAGIRPPGAPAVRGADAYAAMDRLDIVHTQTHPLVAELIDPTEILESGLTFEGGRDREYLGRRAVTARARVTHWDRWDPYVENVTVADEYELLIDSEAGVILRFARRLEDREYGATEMTAVALDEDLPMSLFEPPRR